MVRDFFGAELGVRRLDLEFLDVQRRVVVVFHQLLGDKNRVLEVVTAPWHESHKHITAKRQLTMIGARAVGNHLALLHRSEEHTSELQSLTNLVCRLLLEKKNK